jgi:hypothetical protein
MSERAELRFDFPPAELLGSVMPELRRELRRVMRTRFDPGRFEYKETSTNLENKEFPGLRDHRISMRRGYSEGVAMSIEHDSSDPRKVVIRTSKDQRSRFLAGFALAGVLGVPGAYLFLDNYPIFFQNPLMWIIAVIAAIAGIVVTRSLIVGIIVGVLALVGWGFFVGFAIGAAALGSGSPPAVLEAHKAAVSTAQGLLAKRNAAAQAFAAASICRNCQRTARYVPGYKRYWCDSCRVYL